MSSVEFKYEDDDGEEITVMFPATKEVCPRCEGSGTHLHPDIGSHAYTPEEFFSEYDDEEREQYFTRGGMYDVPCQMCRGKNVIDVIDEDAAKAAMPVEWDIYCRFMNDEAEFEAISRAERRMGA